MTRLQCENLHQMLFQIRQFASKAPDGDSDLRDEIYTSYAPSNMKDLP